MAAVDPVVLAVGTIREVNRSEFVNRETGEVEQRGRKVTLLTRVGFLQFSVPLEFDGVPLTNGEPFIGWLRSRDWSFGGRSGHSFLFESVASGAVVEALGPELVGA